MKLVGVAVACVLLASACGDDGSTGTGADATTTTTTPPPMPGPWGHTFLSTETTHDLVDGTRIRLQFVDGEVRANAGCNHLMGAATFEDDVFVVSEMGSTEMGCDAALHDQDDWLMELLTGQPEWMHDGDSFGLYGTSDTVMFVDRATAEPDRSLEEVLWVVSSIVDGETVSSVPGSPHVEASMTFAGSEVQGNDGCNSFSGPAEVGDGTVTIGTLRATLIACEGDEETLSAAVIATLEGEVDFEIDADQLRLTAADGSGLVLRARD